MVKDWIANLKKPATPKEGVQTIKDVVAAFKAAIISFNDDPGLYSNIYILGMAIRQIFGPNSDFYKNPSKKMADSDSYFWRIQDSDIGF